MHNTIAERACGVADFLKWSAHMALRWINRQLLVLNREGVLD
jgi:hypothetical protein